jgi:hypothetical protein
VWSTKGHKFVGWVFIASSILGTGFALRRENSADAVMLAFLVAIPNFACLTSLQSRAVIRDAIRRKRRGVFVRRWVVHKNDAITVCQSVEVGHKAT